MRIVRLSSSIGDAQSCLSSNINVRIVQLLRENVRIRLLISRIIIG